MEKTLDFAKKALDTLMRKFTVEELPPAMGFHYHQGVFLRGMEEYYDICGEKSYFDYIKSWVDVHVTEEGVLENSNYNVFDDLQPMNLLFRIYEKTGDKRYKKVLDDVMPNYLTWKTNSKGGFWHKIHMENQMWLDSLYMAGPLGVHYGAFSGKEEYIDLITLQLELMWKYMRDERTGLLYHAWDESKQKAWADSKTGLASCFWGRALGWLPAAMVDILDYMPSGHPKRKMIINCLNSLVEAVCDYQDEESGMWYQVINRGIDENNWLESSCSCLFAYGMAKGVRKGYLDKKYADNARRAYKGVLSFTREEGDDFFMDNICVGTGVNNYDGYLARPTSTNDLHGVGAFVMMCCELARLENN